MNPWLIGGMIGLGALQGHQQQKQARQQMLVRAAEQRAAPWTGMAPQTPYTQRPSSFAPMLQGAVSGAMLSQSMQEAKSKEALRGSYKKYLESQTPQQPPTRMQSGWGWYA